MGLGVSSDKKTTDKSYKYCLIMEDVHYGVAGNPGWIMIFRKDVYVGQ